MDSKKNIINQLIELPVSLKLNQKLSPLEVLKRSGYFEKHLQISEDAFYIKLLEFPYLVKEWLDFSENKRTSTGWYFYKSSDSEVVLGYIDNKNPSNNIEQKYLDIFRGCSNFIIKELEFIRISNEKANSR